MAANRTSGIEPTRFESRTAFNVAGLQERYVPSRRAEISQQWQRFAPHIGKVRGQVGATTYGICVPVEGSSGFDYITAVEVRAGAAVPKELITLSIPERRYSVFAHHGHVSSLADTMDAIHTQWLPRSGQQPARAPMFERYGEKFDPQTGLGDIEIWIPLQ